MLYLYVGFGGIIGSVCRFLIASIPIHSYYPYDIFFINMIGAFVLALLTTAYFETKKLNKEISAAIGTGMIGAFTTMSTFSVDVVHLIVSHHLIAAFIYTFTSMIGGLVLAYLGFYVGKQMVNRRVEAK